MILRALLFCLVLLSGCLPTPQSTTIVYSDIYSTPWTLVHMETSKGKLIPQNAHFTLNIEKNKISGKAFNSFSAPAQFKNNNSAPHPVMISDKMLTHVCCNHHLQEH